MTRRVVHVIFVLLQLVVDVQPSPLGGSRANSAAATGGDNDVFLNQWAVHIPGGRHIADQVATDIGFENVGQVSCVFDSFIDFIVMFLCVSKSQHSNKTNIIIIKWDCASIYRLHLAKNKTDDCDRPGVKINIIDFLDNIE